MLQFKSLSRRGSSADATDHVLGSLEQWNPAPAKKRPGRVQGRARHVLLGLGLALAVLPLVAPKPAEAWWSGGVWIGGPAYVVPRYAYVPPPMVYYPPVVYAPPVRRWIPGYYNWRGFWIPGHWVG